MTSEALKRINKSFLPYNGQGKDVMNIFHNKESGEVIIIVHSIHLGSFKFKDLLTMEKEQLANINFYLKTRDEELLYKVFLAFRKRVPEQEIEELVVI